RVWQSTRPMDSDSFFSWTIDPTCNGTPDPDWDGGHGEIYINLIVPAAPTVILKCDGSSSCGTVGYGSSKTLSWTVSGDADSCTASNAWSGSKSIDGGSQSTGAINSNKTWTIQCSGPGGTGPSDSVSATVPAPTVDIKANNSNGPIIIDYNTSATLSWTSSNSGSCTASNGWSGSKALNGSESTGNLTSSKTYTLTCSGNGSNSDSVTVNVSSPPAPTVILKCDGSSSCGTVGYGSSKTLSWTVSGDADSCTASNAWSGSKSIDGGSQSTGAINSNKTWTIQCSGPGGTGPSDSVSATVPAPTVDIKANNSNGPIIIDYNTSATLSWTSSNSGSCTASNGWSGSKALNGSESTGNLTSSKTYTLTCSGNGSNSDSVTVNVSSPPVMNYFRCNGVDTPGTCNIDYGGTAGITWSSSNTTGCSLVSTLPSDDYVSPSDSRNDTNITANRDYSIECWNSDSGVHAPALPLPLHVVVSGPSVDIKANNSNGPITLDWNSAANLSWTSSNAGSCNASGDWSGSKVLNGSQSTGNLTNPKTYNYTLTCSGNGSVSDTVQVILSPPAPNSPTNVTVTPPDYCVSGPAATVNWTYSDPSGSPQSAYETEMDEEGSFQVPEVDSGKVISGSNSYFTGQGILQFNKTYKTRVRVWNSYDVVSGWTVAPGNFNTPPYAYPQVDFSWTANGILNNPSPPLNKPVQFTDATVFNGNPNGRQWGWTFGDGGSSAIQNPSYTYITEGSYYITLTATDNANQSCVRTKGPLIIQKPIPKWREVAPR
ncbi:MAG: PKD domain-containing protein, partial [Patescibacteria group bacterium]